MAPNIDYYKIKILKKFLHETEQARASLLNELIINATDPVIYNRRFRMIRHLNQYEEQVIKKIQLFDTNDAKDFEIGYVNIIMGLNSILNKSA